MIYKILFLIGDIFFCTVGWLFELVDDTIESIKYYYLKRKLDKVRELNSKKLTKSLKVYQKINLYDLMKELEEIREARILVANLHNQGNAAGVNYEEEFRSLKASEYLIELTLKVGILKMEKDLKLLEILSRVFFHSEQKKYMVEMQLESVNRLLYAKKSMIQN